MTQLPSLRERIDEVEARIAQRQEHLPLRWHETQRAASSLLRVHRTLLVIAVGTTVVASYLLLRRPAQSAKAGGLGMLVTAGLTLLRPRYGALYSLAWELLKKRPSSTSGRRPR